jgi:uncharacterized protein YegP (UPF0339 family)
MKFVVYKDARGEYRWRLVAANGRNLADSGEGYRNKEDCLAAIRLVKEGAPKAPVEDTTTAATVGRW